MATFTEKPSIADPLALDDQEVTNSSSVSASSTVHHCGQCGAPMLPAPRLEDIESCKVLYLRCFVRRRIFGGGYIAECLDLDISAVASTVQGAIVGLQDAMIGYLDVVFEERSAKAEFVLRPSPRSHWLRYYFERAKYRVAAHLFDMFKIGAEKRFYKVSPFTHCQI